MSLAWNSTTSWVNGLCCFWPCWLHIWSHCSCFYSFFIIFAFSWAFSLHGKVHNKIFFLFIFYHCQICFLAYISGRVSAKFHNVFCLYFLWLFQPHCGSTFLLFVVSLSCPMHRAPNWQLCMTYFIFLFHQFTVFVLLFFSFISVPLAIVCLVTDSQLQYVSQLVLKTDPKSIQSLLNLLLNLLYVYVPVLQQHILHCSKIMNLLLQ